MKKLLYTALITCSNLLVMTTVCYSQESLRFPTGTILASYPYGFDYMREFNQAIKLNPNYAKAYVNRADIYKKLRDYPQAIADFNQAIKLNPNDSGTYYNRADAYSKLQDYPQAIADYSQAVKLDPNDPEAYFYRGIAYNNLKDYPQAISDLQKSAQLYQQHGDVEGHQRSQKVLQMLEGLK